MGRKEYLQVMVVLIGTVIAAAIGIAAWLIMLVPVMIYPRMLGGFKPADKFTEMFTKRMIKGAAKKSRRISDPNSGTTVRSSNGPGTG